MKACKYVFLCKDPIAFLREYSEQATLMPLILDQTSQPINWLAVKIRF